MNRLTGGHRWARLDTCSQVFRVAVIFVSAEETKNQAWRRHVKKNPEDRNADIKIFSYAASESPKNSLSSMGSTGVGDRTMKLKEILLVDGKVPIISAISFILQSNGYLVMQAPDAETASKDLDNYCFDLMLVYLNGYEKDKLDLLRQANRRSPQTKVMIVANPQRMTLPLEAFQVEVDDYLLTPFSAPELCRRVNHCLPPSKILKPESVFEGR